MKKKLSIISIILVLFLFTTGCGKDEKTKITINCNDLTKSFDMKKNKSFNCTLLRNKYEFKISDIKKDSIVITVSDYGLNKVKDNGKISLKEKKKKFTIERKTETKLRTQTTDYSEYITIYWE